jgi:hypothetical protein
MTAFYAHFEDFVEAYVGPFETVVQCDAHAKFCAQRGDGAVYHGAVTSLPADAFVLSPQEDYEFEVA